MIMKVNYIELKLEINKSSILSIEIENKKTLCKLMNDINDLEEKGYSENIMIWDEEFNELKIKKIKVITNYFATDDLLKKYTNDFIKLLLQSLSDKQLDEMNKIYNKNNSFVEKIIVENDFPLELETQPYETILKNVKIKFKKYKELINNLMQLIDIEKILKIHSMLVFIGLKQFLTKEELSELYKYAIYNNIKILLIDFNSTGVPIKNERKLIIDESLEEYMV